MTDELTNSQLRAERLMHANRAHRSWLSVSILTALLGAVALVSYAGFPIFTA